MNDRSVLWNKEGRVALQVSGNCIFDSRGNSIGWINGEGVYDRSGRHIGWFMGGILRDMYGRVLGFSDRIAPNIPHPELPREKEGAPPSSLQAPMQGKPGFMGAPGIPPLGGKPPLGASWSSFDAQEYFEGR